MSYITKNGSIIRPVKTPKGWKYQVFNPYAGLFPVQGIPFTEEQNRSRIEETGKGFGGGNWR